MTSRRSTRTAAVAAGIGIAAASVLGFTAGPAAARPAPEAGTGTTSLHQSWACSVPSGYVYADVRTNYSCSPGTTSGKEFFLLDYVNYDLTGTWACQIPNGYTYRDSRTYYSCQPGTTSGRQFLLAR